MRRQAHHMQFLSTLSLRRATNSRADNIKRHEISIHALLAESDTDDLGDRLANYCISIHALLAESDSFTRPLRATKYKFLSTLSLRRATLRVLDGSKSSIISIHALLAESDVTRVARTPTTVISIHALLAESDNGHG